MNILDLVETSNQIKSLDLKLTPEQQAELLEVVNLLDISASALGELCFAANTFIADYNTTLSDDVTKLKILDKPTFSEIKESLESLANIVGFISSNYKPIVSLVSRVILTERSVIQTLAYLKTLDYVFEDKPKIILLN